jgi:hypothetical protein
VSFRTVAGDQAVRVGGAPAGKPASAVVLNAVLLLLGADPKQDDKDKVAEVDLRR